MRAIIPVSPTISEVHRRTLAKDQCHVSATKFADVRSPFRGVDRAPHCFAFYRTAWAFARASAGVVCSREIEPAKVAPVVYRVTRHDDNRLSSSFTSRALENDANTFDRSDRNKEKLREKGKKHAVLVQSTARNSRSSRVSELLRTAISVSLITSRQCRRAFL